MNARTFPSETAWLLGLLAAAVLADAWFVAGWLARDSGVAWTQLVMLLSPGPATYVLWSRWRLRRARELDGPDSAGPGRTIAELASAAGVTSALRVRTDGRLGGRAFVTGVTGRPVLVLGPELLALHGMGPDRRAVFEAVVRHELAHLRGGDLFWYQIGTALRFGNAYTAAWVLFGVVLAFGFGDASTGQVLAIGLRAAGLVVLAEAIARAFLRVREHHADLAAAGDDPARPGASAGMAGLLEALAGGREQSVLRAWLRRHPGARRRRAALVEPGVLLASAPGQVLLGATTAGVLLVTVLDLLLRGDAREPDEATVTAGLLVGVPLALFVALTVWRAVWHASATGGRGQVPACAVALFAGLVLGSHLSPYSRELGLGLDGIPFDPSLLAAVAATALVLCAWPAALAAARVAGDPTARRLGPFLTGAGLCVMVVGGWAFAVIATWTARILVLRDECDKSGRRTVPWCRSTDLEADVARSVGADFAFTPFSLLVVALVAGSLAVAARRAPRPAVAYASVAVAAVAATAGLWVAGRAPAAPAAEVTLRPVIEAVPVTAGATTTPEPAAASRQSSDPAGQRAAFDTFACPVDDPLIAAADPALPLVVCSSDRTEKYLLGPAELDGDDVAGATAGFSTAAEHQVTVRFADAARWEELTRRHVDGRIAILVDDVVLVAPQILEPLRDGTAVISGSLTADEAAALADSIGGG